MSETVSSNERILIAKIVAQLLLSDMALTCEESDFLDVLMGRYGLDDGARREVFRGVNVGSDPTEIVSALSSEAQQELLVVLQEGAEADGVIEPAEAVLIAQVREIIEG